MGNYAYELKETTTTINKANFDEILAKIKEEVMLHLWWNYGWRENVLKAETLEDVTKEFGIELIDEGNGNYRPYINGIYVSNFFKYLVDIVAPYMTDGEIQVDDEYSKVTVIFENGKAQILKE